MNVADRTATLDRKSLYSSSGRSSEDKKKQGEPPCPINLKGPELVKRISEWLAFVRREVDEQKLQIAEETSNNHYGRPKEEKDISVCIYDHQSRSINHHDRPSVEKESVLSHDRFENPNNRYNQLAPSNNEFGTDSCQTIPDYCQLSNNCNEPHSDYNAFGVVCTKCNESVTHYRQADNCLKETETWFRSPIADPKPPNAGFNQQKRYIGRRQRNKDCKQRNYVTNNKVQVMNNKMQVSDKPLFP